MGGESVNKKMNLMTWNTSLYSELISPKDNPKFKLIINYVKTYLEKENSIVFLQEIPYCSRETWKEHPLFSELIRIFTEKDYKVGYNIFSINQIMMTIAIYKADSTQLKNKKAYPNEKATNREYAVSFNDLLILGIHAKNGKDNEAYLESLNSEADIVLGDFNAGDYTDSKNRHIFNKILQKHICICNMPTRVDEKTGKRTCIDHVLVRDNLVTKCSNLIVHEDISYSDHFPISFEITL